MIHDLLTNIGSYRGMSRNPDKTIDYLAALDMNTFPLGKAMTNGDRVSLQVAKARARQLMDESYEVHRDYMDIQIDIEGYKIVEIALDGMTPIKEYQPDFQKAAARGGAEGRCVMGPGRFVLRMAGEAHGSGGCLRGPECVKKYVVETAVVDRRP